MSRADKLLERMRRNPRNDWMMRHVERVLCGRGCKVRSTGGRHHVFTHPATDYSITVPANRPIKPVYIRMVVTMADEIDGHTGENEY